MVESGLNVRSDRRRLYAMELSGNQNSANSKTDDTNQENEKIIELKSIADLYFLIIYLIAFIFIELIIELVYFNIINKNLA